MSGSSLSAMAWRNLWRNRRRTLLTLSSIVFGVFLAVLFTAMQDRNWADMIQLAARLGGGHVTLQHPGYLDSPTFSRSVSGVDELRDLALDNPDVTRVVSRISGYNMVSTAGESYGAGFIAVSPDEEDEETLSLLEALVEGEFFETSRDGGIILGTRLAENLDARIGSRVVYTMTDKNGEIVSGLARVSGLIRTGSPGIDSAMTLLPIDTVRDLLGFEADEAIQVAIFVNDQRGSDRVLGELAPSLSEGVVALPWYRLQPELAGFIAMKVGGAVVMEIVIAILVGAGIFNTLFVSVMERMREFGILIAIGVSPGKLFRLVMMESVWMGVVGLVGAFVVTIGPYLYLSATGIDMSAVLGDQTEIAGVAMSPVMKVGIFPENAVLIVVAAMGAILLSGLYPAWRAGHADPVETIRIV